MSWKTMIICSIMSRVESNLFVYSIYQGSIDGWKHVWSKISDRMNIYDWINFSDN